MNYVCSCNPWKAFWEINPWLSRGIGTRTQHTNCLHQVFWAPYLTDPRQLFNGFGNSIHPLNMQRQFINASPLLVMKLCMMPEVIKTEICSFFALFSSKWLSWILKINIMTCDANILVNGYKLKLYLACTITIWKQPDYKTDWPLLPHLPQLVSDFFILCLDIPRPTHWNASQTHLCLYLCKKV